MTKQSLTSDDEYEITLVNLLEDALLEALPFVENGKITEGYKPAEINKVIKRIRNALTKVEEVENYKTQLAKETGK